MYVPTSLPLRSAKTSTEEYSLHARVTMATNQSCIQYAYLFPGPVIFSAFIWVWTSAHERRSEASTARLRGIATDVVPPPPPPDCSTSPQATLAVSLRRSDTEVRRTPLLESKAAESSILCLPGALRTIPPTTWLSFNRSLPPSWLFEFRRRSNGSPLQVRRSTQYS